MDTRVKPAYDEFRRRYGFAKPIAIVRTMMGIAEFIIGRAFARPVGATHPTRCLT